MIDKDILIEYINILEKYNIDNISFTDRENYILNLINFEISNNNEFSEFINRLVSSNDKDKLIEEYINNLKVKNSVSEEEVIGNTFGIDISKIQHKYLDNDKEIFSFFDMKFGRPIVLENKKNGVSLVEQLKEIQAQNTDYQTSDNEKNVQYILENKQFKENCELQFVHIDEIDKHINEINSLDVDDLKKLNFMIKNAYSLGIVTINIENLIGLDKDGKIYEVYQDSELEYKVGEPNSASYNMKDINTSDRVNDNYTINEQNVALQSNFEYNPNVIEESNDIEFYYLPDEIKERTIMFYEYPDLLNNFSTDEIAIWNNYISMYKKKLEKENELNKKKSNVKIKKYIKKNENSGYINFTNIILFVSIILIIVTFVVILR